uniref:Uncharacterized protein n=1 Tax=Anguilla anguilla TaxID=7936 RepID=A0A0E9SLD9_ANGAN
MNCTNTLLNICICCYKMRITL